MPMVMKAGKKVPAYAADGVGKMNKGGMTKKKMAGYNMGGSVNGMNEDNTSVNRSAQGMMSSRGKGATMGMNKGGMANCGASMKLNRKSKT